MPWFKVDDGFYDHPKVENLPMAARGLWLTCGVWCAKHLTDGVISAKRVRALGGTPAQIKALIKNGLWVEGKDDSGAKCYAFHDWFDMQPSREQIYEKREIERQKKRKQRTNQTDEIATTSRFNKMSPGDTGGDNPRDNPGDSPCLSLVPDPTRPDPTLSGGTGSQPSNGDLGAGDMAGGISLDELAAATPRARQAGISDTAINTGTRIFNQRQEPKGPGLLRTLIDEAWADEQDTNRAEPAAQARRQAIDACDLCDGNGMRYQAGEAWRCDHNTETAPNHGPAAPQSDKHTANGQSPQTDTKKLQKRKQAPF